MNEKNLLILSMSVLHKQKDDHNTYSTTENYYGTDNDEKGFYFRGISQLEPGTKYYLRKLQKKGDKLDKIYIIASNEARKEYNIPLEDYPFHIEKDEDKVKEISSAEFYKHRIIQYIQGVEKQMTTNNLKPEDEKNLEKITSFEADIKYDENHGYLKPLNELYPDTENLFCFVDLDDSENDKNDALYKTIYDLCEQIRGHKTLEGEKIQIYLDMQGARRYETFIINAVVKMLEIEDIEVKSSIAVDFLEGAEGYNKIVDTTINDRILDMVSGMNEFIKTGRGDILSEFWSQSKELMPTTDEENKIINEIVNQIEMISDSISLCDVDLFEKNMGILQEKLTDYTNYTKDHTGNNKLFENFVYDLNQDYSNFNLIKQEGNDKIKTTDMIRWCIDKDQYQQALTLLEAKMPVDFVDDRILYCGNPDKLSSLVDYFVNDDNLNIIPDYICDKEVMACKEHHYLHLKEKNEVERKKEKDDLEKFVFIKYFFDKTSKDKTILKSVLADQELSGPSNSDKKCKGTEAEVAELLFRYYELSSYRNNLNHAKSSDSKNIKERKHEIENKLNEFIKKYNNCQEKNCKVDFSERIKESVFEEKKEWEKFKQESEDEINKDEQTIRQIVKSLKSSKKEGKEKSIIEESLEKTLKSIWGNDQQAINDFMMVWSAVYWLENEKNAYEQFQNSDNKNCDVLKRMMDFAYKTNNEGMNQKDFYKSCFDKPRKNRDLSIGLLNKVKNTIVNKELKVPFRLKDEEKANGKYSMPWLNEIPVIH